MRYLDTEIRLMEERDLDKVLEIENLCFINPWKEKDMLYEMKENPLSNLWVIELSNDSLGLKTICGFCDYWQTFDSGTICQIAVHPDIQRSGVGSQLMEEVIKDARAKKVNTLTLEVRESNEKAIKFYTKHGFKIILKKPQYYSNGEDALYMVLEVNR